MDQDGPVVVLVTAADEAEAYKIADGLLEAPLAACVNTLPDISSRYWWHGKLEEAGEVLLIVKSRASLLDVIIKRVKELHSYEVPEIIALPVIGGSGEYLRWLEGETRPE